MPRTYHQREEAPAAYAAPAKVVIMKCDQRHRTAMPSTPHIATANRDQKTKLDPRLPPLSRKTILGNKTATTAAAPQKMARPMAATAAYSPASRAPK